MSLCQATALRVKYRDLKHCGRAHAKINVRVENCGVHRSNRGGVYPAGIRCKQLCIEVIGDGFMKEEFTNKLVAEQEMPARESPDAEISRQVRNTTGKRRRKTHSCRHVSANRTATCCTISSRTIT